MQRSEAGHCSSSRRWRGTGGQSVPCCAVLGAVMLFLHGPHAEQDSGTHNPNSCVVVLECCLFEVFVNSAVSFLFVNSALSFDATRACVLCVPAPTCLSLFSCADHMASRVLGGSYLTVTWASCCCMGCRSSWRQHVTRSPCCSCTSATAGARPVLRVRLCLSASHAAPPHVVVAASLRGLSGAVRPLCSSSAACAPLVVTSRPTNSNVRSAQSVASTNSYCLRSACLCIAWLCLRQVCVHQPPTGGAVSVRHDIHRQPGALHLHRTDTTSCCSGWRFAHCRAAG